MEWVQKPWGRMITYVLNGVFDGTGITVKILEVNPGMRLSDQRHQLRAEHWTVVTPGVVVELQGTIDESPRRTTPAVGDRVDVPTGCWHRLTCEATATAPCQVLEISTGHFDEADIERRSDDFGRG